MSAGCSSIRGNCGCCCGSAGGGGGGGGGGEGGGGGCVRVKVDRGAKLLH